jgi:hypothetical protein
MNKREEKPLLTAEKLFGNFLERCNLDPNKMSKLQYDAMKDSFYVGLSAVFVIEAVCPEKDLPKVTLKLKRDIDNYFMLRSISEN